MNKRFAEGCSALFPGCGTPFFLCACLLLGGLFGCFFWEGASEESLLQVSSYLSDFLATAANSTYHADPAALFFHRLHTLLFLLVGGTLVPGWVGLSVFSTGLGFLCSCSVSSFLFAFGWPGLFPAFFLFALPTIVLFSSVLLVETLSARGISRRPIFEYGSASMWPLLLLCFLSLCLCVVIDWLIAANFLPATVHFMNSIYG